jgi:hypothetical protein
MKYYTIPKEDLIFMEDPFSLNNENQNFQPLIKHKTLLFLSKIPLIKQFLYLKYPKQLFESLVFLYIVKNKKCIKEIYPQENSIYKKISHDLHKHIIQHNHTNLETLTKHFRIGFLDKTLVSCDNDIWNKIDYNCNRITESLKVKHAYNYSILDNEKLWNSFYLSELYVLLKHKFVDVKFFGNNLLINSTKKLDVSLKGMWVSEYLEFLSATNDCLLAKSMSFNNTDERNNDIIDSLLIKVFSIHPEYLESNILERDMYIVLRELIFIASILESNLLTDKNYLPIVDFVNSDFIRNSTVDLVVKILRKVTKRNNYKQYIKIDDDFFVRGGYSFKYGLRTLFKKIIRDRRHIDKDFEKDLGKLFEQYVINYTKTNLKGRFEVFPKFEPSLNAQVRGYDIDMVLFDKIFNEYYFIQAKFNVFNLPIFYSERCHFFQTGKFSKGYNKQLLFLKQNLHEPSIRQKLSHFKLAGATNENSYFILLHNQPYLNFYEHQGILFYEWNLFKNILENCKVRFISNKKNIEKSMSTEVPIYKTELILDSYLNNLKINNEVNKGYQEYEQSSCYFKLVDYYVNCKLI